MEDFPFESSSFPVLGLDDTTDKIKGVGTCTLTRLDDERLFLINSAHTLDIWGDNSPIFIALPNGKTIELPFALKTKSKSVDKVDVAVTPLLGSFASHFNDAAISSLPLYNDINSEDFNQYAKRVVFFGYPSSASRFSIDLKRNEIKAKPLCLTTTEENNLTKKTIETYDIDLSIHIIASFERRKMKEKNGNIKTSPRPQGISGGAVFFVYVEVGEGIDIIKGGEFAGIGNEYLENRSIIKATKKSAISSFIRKNFI